MKLINKDVLLSEIDKRIMDAPINYIGHQRVWAYNDIKDIINTLEVKEVDLKKDNVIGTLEREVKIDAGGYPYIDCSIEFYDYNKDIPLAKEGDKVKVILVKGE